MRWDSGRGGARTLPRPGLPSTGPITGALRGINFPAQSCHVPAGARLLIFSDGVFEIFRDEGPVWDLNACVAHMATLAERRGSLMDDLLVHVYHLRGSARLDDDFSIIEARFH
jgi:sigma-B regulation protein RsbU (phosphoserine phosphatase)